MQNGQEQTKNIDELNETAWQQHANESEQALILSQKAHQLSTAGDFENAPYTKGVAYSLLTMGISVYVVHSDYRAGLQHGLQALNFAEELNDDEALRRAYYVLGVIHGEIGNFLKAIEYHLLRLNLCEELDLPASKASAKMSLGLLYSDLGQYEQSLTNLNQSISLYSELQLVDGLVTALNNLSFVYLCMEDYDKAIETGLIALDKHRESESPSIRNLLLSKLGACYLAIDQLDKADFYLKLALQEVEPLPDKYLHIRAHQRFGALQLRQQQWTLANEHLQKALALAIELGHRQLQFEIHELLGKCLKDQGKFEAALAQYESFYQVKETLFNERTQHQIQALEIEHRTETAVKEAEIYRLKTISLEEMVEKRTQALAEQSYQLQQLLEREQHLAHELQLALEREAELSQIRARIIEVVSHEFRTPLTVINTSADLLKRNYVQLEEAKRETYFKRINNSVFSLADLLQDVTFISQADKDLLKPTYQTLPFQSLCHSLEQALLPAVENRPNVFFSYSYDETLVATDPELIQQILLNLLSNAIQYSNDTSPIHINMTLAADGLHFSVKDQGIGIPKEDLKSIFQLFQRGGNIGMRRGLGLGLSIVKRICDTMEGHVSAHSNGNSQGAVFKIRLPNQLKA